MPQHDFSALNGHYREIIEAMPATFTSHEFILRLAQQHKALYIEALYDYRGKPAPCPSHSAHTLFSKPLRNRGKSNLRPNRWKSVR